VAVLSIPLLVLWLPSMGKGREREPVVASAGD
jgi:hypothetical protein